jgi:hypothetical protein
MCSMTLRRARARHPHRRAGAAADLPGPPPLEERNELVSREQALETYGVVVTTAFEPDEDATAQRRRVLSERGE